MGEDPPKDMNNLSGSKERTSDMSGRPGTIGVLTPPPKPPREMVMEACHPDSLSRESPLLDNTADKTGLSRVSDCNVRGEHHKNTEDKKFAGNTKRGITINGIEIMKYMNMKSQEAAKNTPTRKKKENKGTKKIVNTTPSIVGKNSIMKYVVRGTTGAEEERNKNKNNSEPGNSKNTPEDKIITMDTTNNEKVSADGSTKTTKTTFNTIKNPRVSVSDNIKEFEDLARGGDCIIGGGYCVKHNEKLVREIKTRRMSTIDKNGVLSWSMGEVTILACPVKTRQAGSMRATTTTTSVLTSELSEGGTANKRQRFIDRNEVNQPTEGNPGRRASSDILLDKTEI